MKTGRPGNNVEGQRGRLAIREGCAGVKMAIGTSARCTRLGRGGVCVSGIGMFISIHTCVGAFFLCKMHNSVACTEPKAKLFTAVRKMGSFQTKW